SVAPTGRRRTRRAPGRTPARRLRRRPPFQTRGVCRNCGCASGLLERANRREGVGSNGTPCEIIWFLPPAAPLLTPLFLAAQVAVEPTPMPGPAPVAPVYSGVDGQIVVRTPRLDGHPVVNGVLDEPEWAQAAVLRGFSQYNPLDGRAAEDSTVAYVWYGRDAIYFGIRAYA